MDQPLCGGPPPRIIGVISDTHGDALRTQQAVHVFESLEIDLLLHCGDIGSLDIPPLLSCWPAHFVFGNSDYQRAELRQSIERSGAVCHDRLGTLDLSGRHVAFLHGDQLGQLHSKITDGQHALVCHGHTHRFEQYYQGSTLVLNPGALYSARFPSVAVVDLVNLDVTRIPIP